MDERHLKIAPKSDLIWSICRALATGLQGDKPFQPTQSTHDALMTLPVYALEELLMAIMTHNMALAGQRLADRALLSREPGQGLEEQYQ